MLTNRTLLWRVTHSVSLQISCFMWQVKCKCNFMIAFNNTKFLIAGKINYTTNLTSAYMPATFFFHCTRINIMSQRSSARGHQRTIIMFDIVPPGFYIKSTSLISPNKRRWQPVHHLSPFAFQWKALSYVNTSWVLPDELFLST